MNDVAAIRPSLVNWRQVGTFLVLAFGLTWLLDLLLWDTVGLTSQTTGLALQLQMLLPAFSAILLGTFVFKDSPIHRTERLGPPRVFFYYFLLLTVVYAVCSIASIASPALFPVLSMVGLAGTILGLVVAIAQRVRGGLQAALRAGLAFGEHRYWLLFGAGFVLYYAVQTLLNVAFGLGHPADVAPLAQQAQMPVETLLAVAGIQSILMGPFMGLVIAFGEEYGWRGYLQSELVKLGRVKGILLVGIIWGLWHAPLIVMGYNYPGYPVLGPVLMTLYTIGLGFVLGYAVLKTGSVWLAAYLHALNNQVLAYLFGFLNTPNDPAFSFGIGIYGIACLAVVTLLILRDPIWRQSQGHPSPLLGVEN